MSEDGDPRGIPEGGEEHVRYMGPTPQRLVVDGRTVEIVTGRVYSGRVAQALLEQIPTVVRRCDSAGVHYREV